MARSRYNYNTDHVSEQTGIAIPDDEENRMVKQEFAEEVDINTILRRFNITGQLPSGVRMPVYADFEEVFDFHSAANAIAQANEAFEQMPANVRERFQNDPAKFVAFCDNPNNRAEAERLGLVDPRAPETPPANPSTGGAPSSTTTAPAPAAPAPAFYGGAIGNTSQGVT